MSMYTYIESTTRWPLRGRGAQDDPPGRLRRHPGRADAALQGDVVPGTTRGPRGPQARPGNNGGFQINQWGIP